MATIGLDHKGDRQAVGGPRLGRPDNGHQRSSGSNQARGPLPDIAADEIKHQIDFADVFQDLAIPSVSKEELRRSVKAARSYFEELAQALPTVFGHMKVFLEDDLELRPLPPR